MKSVFLKINIFNSLLIAFLLSSFLTNAENPEIFQLIRGNTKAAICIDKNEATAVQKAAGMFRDDVSEITGKNLSIQNSLNSKGTAIVAGTLGKSKQLKQIIQKYNLNTDSVSGRWEAFSIQLVERKSGNILVIMGSDRRGTAYGLLELSRLIGISPWVWWADVKPAKKSELAIQLPKPIFQHPSVQYRGIFLNDEDWGLKPWASNTFEPKVGEIGPKTYRKIFELLLRLRANTIWPAMHECSIPFYFVNGNAQMADSFGIVISTSHCEPMMRSNPREWDHKKLGDYNFFTNKKTVIDYWNERLTEVSKYENVYTVGMRGVHDGAMEGAKNVAQQVDGLTDVFKEQRQILSKNLHKNAEDIPQIFIPYKEVLDAYNAGLKVPDDVTLLWCDDNYGYMSQLSNQAERERKGGSGVYYHISYWGRPHDYLWLSTTQPSLIWYEMQKAWAYGAQKMWILNVGDIKPAEYLIEFYLDMAWNINSIQSDGISLHLENWMGRTFGEENAPALKNIMDEYYRLAFIRKPEFMGWSQTEPTTKVKPTELNFTEFGDEIATRVKQYDKIEKQADSLATKIPSSLKNAYFELVKYPVSCAAEMNKKWLNHQYANLFTPNNLSETSIANQKSLKAWEKIQQMTAFYNDSIENGKWNLFMSDQPRKLPVFEKPDFIETAQKAASGTIFWPEESEKPMANGDTVSLILDNCAKGIYCFNSDSIVVTEKPDWLSVKLISTKEDSNLPTNKLLLELIPERIKDKTAEGLLILTSNKKHYYLKIRGILDPHITEKDHCIRLKASDFSQNKTTGLAHWQVIEGLGYSRSAMAVQPFDAKLFPDITMNPSLEYNFNIESADSALIRLYMLPIHPADSKSPLRIAVSVDGSKPVLLDFKTFERSSTWKEYVLRNQAIVKFPWKFTTSGKHSIRVFAVVPDVVIDQLMIDFKLDRRFYGVVE